MRSFVTTSTRRNISFAYFCHNQSIPEWALTLISPLEIDISSSLFDIFKMSSRFVEYIVLLLNEKLITGIIEFFLLFNVILGRGHREPSLFTHARARATMRDHARPCATMRDHARPCATMAWRAIDKKKKSKSKSRSLYDLRFRTFSTDGENYVSGVHIYALLYDPLCFIAYRIHSIKRLGVYKIFREFLFEGGVYTRALYITAYIM